MISADDLRVFLEVARRGRLTDAARHLQVNHTTVGRHIARLELSTGQRLFDRTTDGWRLTEAGERLLVHAESVAAALLAAQEDCSSADSSLTGSVRVMTPDGFGAFLLLPGLGPVRTQHRDLTIEVVTANRHASLTPREFDVAVTIEEPKARAVSVEQLAKYRLELYASSQYLANTPKISNVADLHDHSLIWYVDDALDISTFQLLYDLIPDAHPRIQTNNVTGQIRAAEAGLGVAFLPSYIAQRNPNLHRVEAISSNVTRTYWLSIPRDLMRLARVRLMANTLRALVRRPDSGFDPM